MSKEKKIHFNFIDILIVLCFVVLIAGFAFYATGNWQTNVDTQATQSTHVVQYTLTADNLPPEVANAIKVGDTVKDSAKETVKGTIVKVVSKEKYVKEIFNANDGTYVLSEHPENYTVVMVIESSYVLSDNTAMIDDSEIKVGKKIHYKTPGYAFEAYITGVENIEK